MIKGIYKEYKRVILVLYILCAAMVCLLCYLHAKPTKDEQIFIFVSGQLMMKNELTHEMEDIAKDFGILEVGSFTYDELDSDFPQIFATKGYYSSDLYILSKEVIENYKDSGAFKEINENLLELTDNYITNSDGEVIAIALNESMYILVGQKRNKPDDVITELVKCIFDNGDDLFEK